MQRKEALEGERKQKNVFLLLLDLHPHTTETCQSRVIITAPRLHRANIPLLAAGGSGMFENMRVQKTPDVVQLFCSVRVGLLVKT